jgi:hypothetical protein
LTRVFLAVGSGLLINTGSCRAGENLGLNFDSGNPIGKYNIFFKHLKK